FLRDLVILFGVAVVVSYAFRVLRLSSIAGFLVAGTLAGPFGLGLISSVQDVERMAEIGVMLLLFSIGIEFSTEKLIRMKWLALGGGSLQVIITTVITAVAVYAWGAPLRTAIFAGILVALSSTVIALRLLYERGQAFAPQGGVSLAILVFQDIAVVPIMLFLPILTGQQTFSAASVASTVVISFVAVVAILITASFLVPRVIAATIASRSRDIFILSVIVTVLGIAYLTSRAGLSTALGAFVAGIVISESEYSHQVLADVLPFRETFNSLFFVSIGMLLDPAFVLTNAGTVVLLATAALAGKTVITAGVVHLCGMPFRIAAMVGLYLAQIGEFSLVLLTAARPSNAFSETFNQTALAVILVTMVAAPFLAMLADKVGLTTREIRTKETAAVQLSDHTIVVGYGLNGQNVAASLRARDLPYVILEMNPKTVRTARSAGEPIYYGDAIGEVVLRRVGMERALCAVFAISDPLATRQAVAAARRINAGVYIIARTRYIAEIEQLYQAGADTVIAEEFETSLEIIRRILGRLGYRPATIDREILSVRQRRYEMFRGGPIEKIPIQTHVDFEPFEVEVRKKSAGKSLADLRIRETTGATVIAVRRDSGVVPNPGSGHVLEEGDHVYLIGSEEEIRRAMRLL
ncbi:MAG: cation:proton antiporter, partial [Acidobacteria bacterium]|nr:cation:proton antiporter [Acidobacteriota bacterium]